MENVKRKRNKSKKKRNKNHFIYRRIASLCIPVGCKRDGSKLSTKCDKDLSGRNEPSDRCKSAGSEKKKQFDTMKCYGKPTELSLATWSKAF